jgi:hypothetical protein
MGPALLPALLSATFLQAEANPKLSWSRDNGQAFIQAEERGAPVLIQFRGQNCGGRSTPGATEDRGGTGMAGGISRPQHATELTDCDLMQQEVWESARIARAAERYLSVLADSGDQTLNVKYQVVVNPTTLITDPWGNEVFRVAGYLDPDKVERILNAVPKDFSALAPSARALRQDGSDPKALLGAAGYYESQGLRQVSERLYDKAASAPTVSADPVARRQVVIARGLNLLLMGRDKDAAGAFQKELDKDPTGAGSDALLLGLVNAHLQGGRRREAETAVKALEKSFPESRYTARARENLAGQRQ